MYNHRGEKGRGEIGGDYCICALSSGAYTTILLVSEKGGVHPPPSPGWDEFTIMMECTPESGHHLSTFNLSSVCTTV